MNFSSLAKSFFSDFVLGLFSGLGFLHDLGFLFLRIGDWRRDWFGYGQGLEF